MGANFVKFSYKPIGTTFLVLQKGFFAGYVFDFEAETFTVIMNTMQLLFNLLLKLMTQWDIF